MEAWIRAVGAREPRAPGKSGMLTAAIKQLALRYMEPVLRFVPHVPIRKRPVVRIEEDTRPIAMEKEVTKLVAAMIIARIEQYLSDRRTREGGPRGMSPAF